MFASKVRSGWALALVILTAQVACHHGQSPARPAASEQEDLGDDGALFIALGPGDWSGLDAIPAALAAQLPGLNPAQLAEEIRRERAELGSPWLAVRGAAVRLGLPELPATPDGLDPKRPILINAAVPVAGVEELGASLAAVLAGARTGKPAGEHERAAGPPIPFGMRHRVILPAKDPAALVAGLRDALTRGGLRPVRGESRVLAGDSALIRFSPRRSWVAVDLVMGPGLATLDQATQSRVLGPAERAPVVPSPLFTAGKDSLVRVHLRLDHLARVGACAGMAMVARALGSVARGPAAAELMQGTSEVLTPLLLVDPDTALFSDLVIDIPLASPASPVLYLVATDRGRRVLAADANLGAGAPVAPLSRLDLPAMVAAAPPNPLLAGVKGLSEAAETLNECGYVCSIYLAAGNALGALRALDLAQPGTFESKVLPLIRQAPFSGGRATLVGSVLVIEPLHPAAGAAARARGVKPRAWRRTPAEACYARALGLLRSHFRAAAGARDRTEELIESFRKEAAADLACAGKQKDLAARVASLRAFLTALEGIPADSPAP